MPRITITLTEQQHQLFQSLTKYTGKPMSGYISDLLHASTPVLERMAAVFQRIHQQQQKEKNRLTSELEQVQDALEPIASNMLNQFDLFLAKVAPVSDEQADARPPRPNEVWPDGRTTAQPSSTPHTNRGDTPPHGKTPNTAPNKPRRSVRPREVLKKNKGLNS